MAELERLLWYFDSALRPVVLACSLSYWDLQEMMAERGLKVDASTLYRWMQAYAPELDRRIRRKLKPTNACWYVDETYIRVKGVWTYLYRAVDASGQAVEFLLSAHRDTFSAKRFFEKALRSSHNGYPGAMIVDRNPAYPAALSLLKQEGYLGEEAKLMTGRWVNNQVKQDHRRIKRLVRPGPGFKEFCSAGRTIPGYEAMSMIRKGQVGGVGKVGWKTASVLVEALFGVGA